MSSIWQIIEKAVQDNRSCALATVIGVKGSSPQKNTAKMLVYANGDIEGTVGGGAFEYEVVKQAVDVLKVGKAKRIVLNLTKDLGMCCGGLMEVFLEPIEMNQHLYIYGAGHVGTALANMAVLTGFCVTVIDERTEWLDSESMSNQVMKRLECPLLALDGLRYDQNCYHFITTHSHALDQDILQKIHSKPMKWLGMIGSRAKKQRFIKRFSMSEIDLEKIQYLHTPAGIDIHARTPGEIAVSILAQLVQIKNAP